MERIIEPSCPGGGGPTPPLPHSSSHPPFPGPGPPPPAGPPTPPRRGPRPPGAEGDAGAAPGQADKQGWSRTGQEDGMSSGRSRTGGPCPPPARRERVRAIAGSLHASPSLAPSMPPTQLQGTVFSSSVCGERRVPSSPRTKPLGGPGGLLLGRTRSESGARSSLWLLGRGSFPS